MKTSHDPRHQKRITRVKDLFSLSFAPQKKLNRITDVVDKLPAIDTQISTSAPLWPLEKISKIDLAILRLACFELLFERQTPPKVAIDEAIEMAKEFGNDASPSFINGVLGTVLKDLEQRGES